MSESMLIVIRDVVSKVKDGFTVCGPQFNCINFMTAFIDGRGQGSNDNWHFDAQHNGLSLV